MSNLNNPWSDLNPPSRTGQYSSKRISTKTPHDFFWALNSGGQFCLIFQCELTESCKIDTVQLKGIELEQTFLDTGQLNLILKLIDGASRDLFRTIVNDLVRATNNIEKKIPATVINAINTRLRRWQELLSRKNNEILSKSEQIGLFGELLFLRNFLINQIDLTSAIEAWQGPFCGEQDFGWSNYLFEVKTQLSTSDKRITINSLEQLDHISGHIWLIYQTLSTDESSSNDQFSLLKLVNTIQDALAENIFAYDQFSTALFEYGYEEHPAYDKVLYHLNQCNIFRVDDDFPKLTRSDTSLAITSARYILDVTALQRSNISEDDFVFEVFRDE